MRIYIFCLLLLSSIGAIAQPTVGLLQYDVPNTDGYFLLSPMQARKTFLVDKCGRKIKEWKSLYNPGLSCYLLDHGILLKTGSDSTNNTFGVVGGILEKRDWNDSLIWQIKISSTQECQHHDIHVMPNGNILAIVWELKTKPQAIAQGRRPLLTSNAVWSEKILEIQPSGTNGGSIVWEWHLWDHMIQDFDSTKPNFGVVNLHPELIDINRYAAANKPDWIHLNSIDYNPATDQILLSSHVFNEIWIIDHSTTTAVAATHSGGNSGKGGDFLYRWGNPMTYKRGTLADKKLFGQHNAQWLRPGYPNEGKILIFNNGLGRTPIEYSSIDIIDPPIGPGSQYLIDSLNPFLPDSAAWTYSAPTPADFYSHNIAGVVPLTDGSFVICEGATGRTFEINPNQQIVWQYMNPYAMSGPIPQGAPAQQNNIFRAPFYPADSPIFDGLTLTPGLPIELNPITPSICDSLTSGITVKQSHSGMSVWPNPTDGQLNINLSEQNHASFIYIYNIFGQLMISEQNKESVDLSLLPKGIYLLKAVSGSHSWSERIIRQ